MYACRMPDSSELKKPIEPSGERNGMDVGPFLPGAAGVHKTLEVAQRVLARLTQSRRKIGPPRSAGPASVISRSPRMSVAKW